MKSNVKISLICLYMFASLLFTYTFLLTGNYSIQGGGARTYLYFDINNFSKMFAMVVLSVVMVCLLAVETIRGKVHTLHWVVFGILIFVFLFSLKGSSASIRGVSILGNPERYEGLLMWISYAVFFLYVLNSKINMLTINKLTKIILNIFLVCSIIGAFQFFGFDLMKSRIFRALMSPYDLWDYSLDIVPSHRSKIIYSTLANPNYVSFLYSIILPGITYWILKVNKVRMKHYLLWGLFFFCLLGSKSSGGTLGFLVSASIAFFVLSHLIMCQKKRFLTLVAVSIICLIPNIGNVFDEVEQIGKNDERPLINITRVEEGIVFESRENQVMVSFDFSTKTFSFIDGRALQFLEKENRIFLEDPYEEFEFYIFENQTFGYMIGNKIVKVVFVEGDYYVVNSFGRLTSTWGVPTSPFITNERFGTGRGYIWSRSIPLLSDTLFLGKGADTFVYYFPQNDILGKSTGLFEGPFVIVDKPHSTYIQIAFSFGLVFALFFFGAFVAYVIYAMKLTRLKEPTTVENYIIGIGFSMIAFLVSALFYDLSVHVTPTVILMLGIGIVLLRLRREEQQAELVESETVVVELES